MKKIIRSVFWLLFATGILGLVSCQQAGLSPGEDDPDGTFISSSDVFMFDKKGNGNGNGGGNNGGNGEDDESGYPHVVSDVVSYLNPGRGYEGGNIHVNGGSKLHLDEGSLTPPEDTPIGEDVLVTMVVDINEDGSELIFEFGEPGCVFDPPARVTFCWEDLDVEEATLYYIDEDGNYIEQEPDDIDEQGKNFILYISHFSRYGLTRG